MEGLFDYAVLVTKAAAYDAGQRRADDAGVWLVRTEQQSGLPAVQGIYATEEAATANLPHGGAWIEYWDVRR